MKHLNTTIERLLDQIYFGMKRNTVRKTELIKTKEEIEGMRKMKAHAICKHIAKAAQSQGQTKVCQRACKATTKKEILKMRTARQKTKRNNKNDRQTTADKEALVVTA